MSISDGSRGNIEAMQNVETSQATMDSVLTDIVTDMPEPSPIADRPVNPAPEQETPVKRGRGRPRKDGKPSETKTAPPLAGVAAASAGIQSPNPHAAAAQCAIMLAVMPATLLAGDGGVPNQAEVQNMQGAFEVYFKEKGIDNVPAWVLVTGAIIPFYARVLMQEKAKSKFSRVIDAVKNLFKRKHKSTIENEYVYAKNENVA